MNYLTHVKPLEDAGYNAAQIAAILGTVRTRPVPLSELEAKLTLWGVLARDPETNDRTGPLVGAALTEWPLKPVAVQLLSWLGSSRSQQVSTDSVEVSPIWAAGLAAMVAGSILTQSQADILNALAGPLVHPGVTADQVTACLDAYLDEQAALAAAETLRAAQAELRTQWQPLHNSLVATVLDGPDPTVANLVAALQTMIEQLEA